jgi:hypothetical protein
MKQGGFQTRPYIFAFFPVTLFFFVLFCVLRECSFRPFQILN